MTPPKIDNPKAILLIRLSALGDVVMASGVIRPLRVRWPGARLVWLAQPESAPLLRGHPDLDEVIVWPKGQWLRLWRSRRYVALWREIRHFRRRLRKGGFDLALDLQGLLKSGVLAWLSGAPVRLGLGSREGSGRLMSGTLERGGESRLIASEYRYLVRQLGLDPVAFRMGPAPCASDREAVRSLLQDQEGRGPGYVVLCPFTTRPQKHWVEERWGPLMDSLGKTLGMPVLLLGGPDDREAARRIMARLDLLRTARPTAGAPRVRDLTGRTGIGEAAALIQGAALLVGVDTGLSHMGIAFGIPSVLLFGATRPYLDTGRANAEVIYHPMPCSPCRRRPTCHGDYTCMRSIESAHVMAAITRVGVTRGGGQQG